MLFILLLDINPPVAEVEYASLMFTILFSSGPITIVAVLKNFFSILSEIKKTIRATKLDANNMNFIFFFANNKKKLRSAMSNASNNSDVLVFILSMYSIYLK